MTFDEKWLEPGAVVPVTIESAQDMMNEIRRLRSASSEDLVTMDGSLEAKKADYWTNVLTGGWIQARQEAGIKELDMGLYSAIREGIQLGLANPVPRTEQEITINADAVRKALKEPSG